MAEKSKLVITRIQSENRRFLRAGGRRAKARPEATLGFHITSLREQDAASPARVAGVSASARGDSVAVVAGCGGRRLADTEDGDAAGDFGRPRSRPRSATTRFGRRGSPRTSRMAGRLSAPRKWRITPAARRRGDARRSRTNSSFNALLGIDVRKSPRPPAIQPRTRRKPPRSVEISLLSEPKTEDAGSRPSEPGPQFSRRPQFSKRCQTPSPATAATFCFTASICP